MNLCKIANVNDDKCREMRLDYAGDFLYVKKEQKFWGGREKEENGRRNQEGGNKEKGTSRGYGRGANMHENGAAGTAGEIVDTAEGDGL